MLVFLSYSLCFDTSMHEKQISSLLAGAEMQSRNYFIASKAQEFDTNPITRSWQLPSSSWRIKVQGIIGLADEDFSTRRMADPKWTLRLQTHFNLRLGYNLDENGGIVEAPVECGSIIACKSSSFPVFFCYLRKLRLKSCLEETGHAAPADYHIRDESNYGTDPVLAHGALLATLSYYSSESQS